MIDNTFCSCRYVCGPPDYELKTVLLDVAQPKSGGAEGLLEASVSALKRVNCENLFGIITTDGESSNPGKKDGLWHSNVLVTITKTITKMIASS